MHGRRAVPQRRRRVFVVGYLGDWRSAAAVLFERDCLSGNPAPSRKAGEGPATSVARSLKASGGFKQDETHETHIPSLLTMRDGKPGGGKGPLISEDKSLSLGTGNNQVLFEPQAFYAEESRADNFPESNMAPPAKVTQKIAVASGSIGVRRLTPRECERLQGFPDDYTAIPWRGKSAEECPDGPRYKAIGNSMAAPVMRWIGQRIQAVEELNGEKKQP